MTVAHYRGGYHPGNDLGLHYTALPPIVASCPYSDQLLVTRKFWSPGANRPNQANAARAPVTEAHRHQQHRFFTSLIADKPIGNSFFFCSQGRSATLKYALDPCKNCFAHLDV